MAWAVGDGDGNDGVDGNDGLMDMMESRGAIKLKATTRTGLVGIYLAAGSSKRMGMAKLSLELAGGVRLGGVALLQALRSDLDYIVIVTNDGNALDWLPEEARKHIQSGRCRVEICREAEHGMAYSLHTGIRSAEALGAGGALVMLADQPFVTASMLTGLMDSFQDGMDCDYVASGDEGMPKPPVILGRGMWAEALALKGDAGARSLFRVSKFRGRVIPGREGLPFMDVDTPEEFEQAILLYKHKNM